MIYTTSGKIIQVFHHEGKVRIELSKTAQLVYIMFELDEENKKALIKELMK